MLSDGHTTFTAGLSSTINNLTLFRHEDLLGSLRFQTNSSQSVTGSGLFLAFGGPVGSTGISVPFGWVGGADCQTEADTGLVLMGHRYYDTRIGRFLSQDPAGKGNNWYAYAGNDPVNNTDPSGLSAINMFSAPDGRNQGQLGGNSGSLMDFFANIDYWGSQGQSNGTSLDSGGKSKQKSEPVYDTKDKAGIEAAKKAYLSNTMDQEYFGFIISIITGKTITYTFTIPVPTKEMSGTDASELPVPPTDAVGWYHSHPDGLHQGSPDAFSEGDNRITQDAWNVTAYLGTRNVILKAELSSTGPNPVITNLRTGWNP